MNEVNIWQTDGNARHMTTVAWLTIVAAQKRNTNSACYLSDNRLWNICKKSCAKSEDFELWWDDVEKQCLFVTLSNSWNASLNSACCNSAISSSFEFDLFRWLLLFFFFWQLKIALPGVFDAMWHFACWFGTVPCGMRIELFPSQIYKMRKSVKEWFFS